MNKLLVTLAVLATLTSALVASASGTMPLSPVEESPSGAVTQTRWTNTDAVPMATPDLPAAVSAGSRQAPQPAAQQQPPISPDPSSPQGRIPSQSDSWQQMQSQQELLRQQEETRRAIERMQRMDQQMQSQRQLMQQQEQARRTVENALRMDQQTQKQQQLLQQQEQTRRTVENAQRLQQQMPPSQPPTYSAPPVFNPPPVYNPAPAYSPPRLR